ncbi:hypothetical protein PF005_g246 [Phytophthora fragariae]|uniref:Secreted protein n=1 Tax=Phytophthora fragariae TaxID=53985 RepID=A0A6A4F8Q4_9STRA|nr:hypothetical protein PF003_g8328 [Phytophthora fragariae]KAE8950050.1 hypothetical protein PF009_g413 [Phytophthora fragariae]KAE9031267.1 hypothetical protein PF011_g187 [Phytophthora fragariae]KAE9141079.1 hypothetical protein PF007_g374 [Phytophthora fragariae]KAE9155957.1 hypothetical protein PF006_g140 [Phytophthora fragariae]
MFLFAFVTFCFSPHHIHEQQQQQCSCGYGSFKGSSCAASAFPFRSSIKNRLMRKPHFKVQTAGKAGSTRYRGGECKTCCYGRQELKVASFS